RSFTEVRSQTEFGNEDTRMRDAARVGRFSMPLFGAHTSIAGGCHKALELAQGHGMDTVQLFTKNSNQWNAKPLTDEDLATFRRLLGETGLRHPTAHDSYLINLA